MYRAYAMSMSGASTAYDVTRLSRETDAYASFRTGIMTRTSVLCALRTYPKLTMCLDYSLVSYPTKKPRCQSLIRALTSSHPILTATREKPFLLCGGHGR